AAYHAFGVEKSPLNYDQMLDVVFTDPQVARVGLTEKKLRERSIDFITAEYRFDDHGKSYAMGAENGFGRLFAEKLTGRIMGAERVAKGAGELIHALSVAVSSHRTASYPLTSQGYPSSLAQSISYPLKDIVNELANQQHSR